MTDTLLPKNDGLCVCVYSDTTCPEHGGTGLPKNEAELRMQLKPTVGLAMFGPKYWDYIEAPQGTLGGKYPSERAIADLNTVLDKIMETVEARDTKMLEQAYSLGQQHALELHNSTDTDERRERQSEELAHLLKGKSK